MKNGVMFQGFEWYYPADGSYYRTMQKCVDALAKAGVSAIWLPPVYKGTGPDDVGYGVYDLYDLGEFEQKGAIRTKYGTKEELMELIDAIHKAGMQAYADVVLNHKAGADEKERFQAIKVDEEDRTKEVEEPREIEGWTKFTFPGRKGKYSDFQWNHTHFNGVDYDGIQDETAIFRILGEHKGWNLGVSTEKGNYDYLMFADIDHAHPQVQEELFHWAEWFVKETGFDGFRLDAVKHIDQVFMQDFQKSVREKFGSEFYMLGEYWHHDINVKEEYLVATEFGIQLFDVGLHFNLYEAAQKGSDYDLRRIFDQTLVKEYPDVAVTFVDNHDSQPGQSLASWVEPWFKEAAYALVLLRRHGYPCVFYGDYYGIGGDHPLEGMKAMLDRLMLLRRHFVNGEEETYFASEHHIGWVRHGDEEHPAKAAIVISNHDEGTVRMYLGESEAGKVYVDILGHNEGQVTIDEEGYGDFLVSPAKVSVWLEEGLSL